MAEKKVKLMKYSFFREDKVKKELIEFITAAERLSMWDKCLAFENEFSIFQGRKYTTLVNSGSSANLALLQAMLNLGYLKKGDKVAFTALTWATNVMPIIQLGLVPLPVDIDLTNLNSSSTLFEEAIQEVNDIKAFFITNVLGFCADIDKIASICEEKGIYFIEDNCESFGTEYKNKKLGNYGLASTFSFFVGHHLSAIEGGAICTDDEELNNMLVMVRAHGWDRSLNKRKQDELKAIYSVDPFYDQYTFYDLAYNIRPTEITGFLASLQLKFASEIISKRENNFRKLNGAALYNNDIVRLETNHITNISNFAFPVVFKATELFEKYKKKFLDGGVEIRPIVGGNMLNQPFFKKYCKNTSEFHMSNADFAHTNGFYLPNNPDLNTDEIDYLIDLLGG